MGLAGVGEAGGGVAGLDAGHGGGCRWTVLGFGGVFVRRGEDTVVLMLLLSGKGVQTRSNPVEELTISFKQKGTPPLGSVTFSRFSWYIGEGYAHSVESVYPCF